MQDLGPLPQTLATGVRVTAVDLLQATRIPVAVQGEAVFGGPVGVAGKAALLRVFFEPAETAPVTMVATLRTDTTERVFAARGNRSPLTLRVDEHALQQDVRLSVELRATDGDSAASGPHPARSPREAGGHPIPLMTNGGLDVQLVPVEHVPSGDRVELGPEVRERIAGDLGARWPVAAGQLRISVGAPLRWESAIDADGVGLVELLEAVRRRRDADGTTDEVYTMALVRPGLGREVLCARRCVTGISPIVPSEAVSLRAGVVLWLEGGDDTDLETLAHELAHLHGRGHAPCDATEDLDDGFPRADGTIGAEGWDGFRDVVHPPAAFDLMGYCEPQWISPYTRRGLAERMLEVTGPRPLSGTGAANARLFLQRHGQTLLLGDTYWSGQVADPHVVRLSHLPGVQLVIRGR